MLTIEADGTVTIGSVPDNSAVIAPIFQVASWKDLDAAIQQQPGEFAVKIWNSLAEEEPRVEPIQTKKFRNRQTAVERLWKRLMQLYPDGILLEDMPQPNAGLALKRAKTAKDAKPKISWATELETELRKKFKPGDSFKLPEVYKLIPAFQRRHQKNQHIAARLRTTLAQDLRGRGIVKSTRKGQYRMMPVRPRQQPDKYLVPAGLLPAIATPMMASSIVTPQEPSTWLLRARRRCRRCATLGYRASGVLLQ